MTVVDHRTGEIIEREPNEAAAVAMLERAIADLTSAVDSMPISEVASLKAQIKTAETATRELNMSREAQELAAEAVRRAEWALGRAIRKGQAEGSVSRREGNGLQPASRVEHRPSDFATRGELHGNGPEKPGILALAEAADSPEDFDAALSEARAEGNLSRANVARKAREKSGKQRKSPRRPLVEISRHAGLELIAAIERVERVLADDRYPAEAEQVAPQLRNHLTSAIETCQGLLDRIND